MLVVEPARPEDLDGLAALEAAALPSPWGRAAFAAELTRPAARLDVARAGGALAGFACAWLVVEEVQLHVIATAPAHRRAGVASALLAHLFAAGRAAGCRACTLEVRRGNAAAIALYRRTGFEVVHTRRGYYQDDGEDALVMVAPLDRATGSSR